ncbi:type IV secretion system DNA-binding domain-containing protein, partial [Patescibacteria group bacterium]
MLLDIRIPRDNEYTPESAEALFSGFTKTLSSPPNILQKLLKKTVIGTSLTLEMACLGQQIYFFAEFDDPLFSFFQSQLLAAYPMAIFNRQKNYLEHLSGQDFPAGQLGFSTTSYYPLKTYKEFADIDPLSSLWAVMSKATPQDFFLFQVVITKAPKNWQGYGQKAVETGIVTTNAEGTPSRQALPNEALIKQKTSELGLTAGLRLAANSQEALNEMAGTFAAYARGDGNSLTFNSFPRWRKKKFCQSIVERTTKYIPSGQIFSVSELATLWHLPNNTIKIPNILWGRSILSEAPDNLPTSIGITDEEKKDICFIGRTEFKNQQANFGLKKKDRRRHIYIVGKTGTGKSTLLSNMITDDFKKGQGVAVIDPHGDLCEELLNYIPSSRINDVCYFNPADRENPISLNILETGKPIDAELVTSGIVSIFHKLYGHSWGPRLEHILRNTVMTLAKVEGHTLVDILRMLSDKKFRDNVLKKLDDPVLQSFWRDEFEKMPDRLQKEAISPIQNKVGQFVTSTLVRGIVGKAKSSLTLETIMDQGKILLVNLSQGRLGEDNAALLGAMMITKIQQSAMHRVNVAESQRKDFYLYVDEFQNFATPSFIKILSEARKYRLNLTLANQYMAQIEPEIQHAIFGNTGSMICFVVGADDASILEKEFGEVFTQKDLVSLDRFQIACKLTIDSQSSQPFLAYTLAPFKSSNQNRDKIIRVSRERYAYQKEAVIPPPPPPSQAKPTPAQPRDNQPPPVNQPTANKQKQGGQTNSQPQGNQPRPQNQRQNKQRPANPQNKP